MVAMIRAAAVIVCLIGSLWAGFVMLMGPLISTPTSEGGYLLAALGYPVLTLLAGFVVAVSLRAGLVLGILALSCVVVVMKPYRVDESISDIISFGWMIAWPPVCMVILTIVALYGREHWE